VILSSYYAYDRFLHIQLLSCCGWCRQLWWHLFGINSHYVIIWDLHCSYNDIINFKLFNIHYTMYGIKLTTLFILFFIKSIKHPSDKFDILNHVNCTTSTTRSAGIKKTAHINPIINSCLPRLWNSLPIIDLNLCKWLKWSWKWNHNFDNPSCKFHLLCPCSHCSKTPPTIITCNLHVVNMLVSSEDKFLEVFQNCSFL